MATGESGLQQDGEDFALALGARALGPNPYKPDYFIPTADYGYLGETAFVMYSQGQRIEASDGEKHWVTGRTPISTATCSISARISIPQVTKAPVKPA